MAGNPDIKILISKKIASELLEEHIRDLLEKEKEETNEEVDTYYDSHIRSLRYLR